MGKGDGPVLRPIREPAEWVTEYESYLTDANDNPVTERRLYADAQGRASWRRVGTRDRPGAWTVRVTQEDTATTLTYPVNQLTLTPIGSKTLGLEFRLYQGPRSNTYYTGDVPGALTVDLQDHLKLVTDSLRRLSGLQSDQTPTIYLVADLELLKQVSESAGSTLGFADGYYRIAGEDSGIYMHTDSLLTGIQRLLTHEYVHLALSETVGPVDLPSWLNEGTATYYEYLINVSGKRANATKHPLYRSAGIAKNAARSGNLLALTNLEDQDAWNSQTEEDRIDLQYAQSHMAVRYLAETYGTSTPIDMMTRMGQGATLSEVFSEIVGVEYLAFEQQFTLWLKSWEDPERTRIAEYIRGLNEIMSAKASIGDRRSMDLASGATPAERVVTKRSLSADAEGLLTRIGNLSPPPELQPLQDDAIRFMERFVRLLALELEHLLDQEYLVFLGNIISSIDSISRLRAEDIQGGAPAGQRVTAKQGLVADAETLVGRLLDAPPPPSLNALQLQELAFLDRYIQFLTLELEQQREEVYLHLLTGIITEVDGISSRRSESIQSTGSSSQRIATAEGLVSDSESLLSQMDTFTPPSRLQTLQLQGTTYLKKYIQWLTIELEFAQTNDSAKLDQANAMIAGINSLGNAFRTDVVKERRAQPNQNEANDMLGEIGDLESLLVQGINTGFRNSATLQQANAMLGEVNARENKVRIRIGDLEFIYNLRQP
ncbi:MAG: hypothetical protein MK210_00140 [Dehalococcoidia bacterium]|nr:hypothetical protein [Dehalococcoidia bacterium]